MSENQRIDKWLWHARFFKTRTLAAKVVSAGHVRVNSERVKKPSSNIKAGDGLSFMQGRHIRIVRITALGDRRGPAAEAQALYEDLTPEREAAAAPIERVGIRPTKKDRRALDSLRHTDS
ncbi:MAG: RNA-binding S4 domain-containing protein [Rhodobacteraceae bacterium]|nr:RNA-binding S4 domain-containing protein [Paracoccaceae bacterium]